VTDVQTAVAAATWRALGTYVHLDVADPAALGAAEALARQVLDEVDAACSRFITDSDLTRANDGAGSWVDVPAVLVGAVRVALDAARQTAGLVDPTLGVHLLTAGYDRTFPLLLEAVDDPVAVPAPPRLGAWRHVGVRDGAIMVPAGSRLDLGATGKAYAADLVAAAVVEQVGVPVIVSVGGDIAVGRPAADHQIRWPVRIGDTLSDLTAATALVVELDLLDGGLATSSTMARRWQRGGVQFHHLIDPRTGVPVVSPWRTVSALGRSCVAANTASTAAFILGPMAPQWLTDHAVAARLVDHAGRVTQTPGWPSPTTEEHR
jgi:thiamine biosynthesis lipoprotein